MVSGMPATSRAIADRPGMAAKPGGDSDTALFVKLRLTALKGEEPMRASGQACKGMEAVE